MDRLTPVLGVVLLLAIPSLSWSATASATASVTIVTPIAIADSSSLEFGDTTASNTADGAVTVSAKGSVSYSGGAAPVANSARTPHEAEFAITGLPGTPFSVTLPSSTVLTGSGGSLVMSDFTSSLGKSGVIGTDGSATLAIGATVVIPAGSAVSGYTGSFDVTINYN